MGQEAVTQDRIVAWLAQQDLAVYLVGGYVRDRLLGRPIYDLDVAVAGDGLDLSRRLANRFRGAYYPLDETRSTGRAILRGEGGQRLVVDVARFRGPDLAADLADRDFTINALAADVRAPGDIRAPGGVIDHHGGLADLASGIIRPLSSDSIRNDPLRALRAVRLSAELDFVLAPETETLIRRDGAALEGVAGERVRDELARLLAMPHAAPGLNLLDRLGLLAVLLPELEPLRGLKQPLPHHLDGLDHSLETVRTLEGILEQLRAIDNAQGTMQDAQVEALAPFAGRLVAHFSQWLGEARPRLVTLKLAALLHDTGKPAARSVEVNPEAERRASPEPHRRVSPEAQRRACPEAPRRDQTRIRFIGHHQGGAKISGGALRRLRFNRAEVRLAETIVRHHMRPLLLASQGSVSSRAVYRFFRDTEPAGVDVLIHALADHRATYAPGTADEEWSRLVALTARMLADYWDREGERVAPPPLVDGHDLLDAFDLQPGPQVGELLEAVREAQVSGEVRNRDDALALIRAWLADIDDTAPLSSGPEGRESVR